MPDDDVRYVTGSGPAVKAGSQLVSLPPTRSTGARTLREDAWDGPRPSFSRALWRIASADVSCGNKVTLLHNGPSTFDAKLALIGSAKESMEFEGYIFNDDDVGRAFVDAFAEAAKRGVRVRILIDWFGRLPTRKKFFQPAVDAGAELRFFNPPGMRSWLGALPRDHRKLLIVDGKTGITGGLGIGQEWGYGPIRRRRKGPWRDTAVQIEGPAAADMREAFVRMWARARGRTHEWRRLRRQLGERNTYLNTRFDPPSLVGIIEGDPARLRLARALQLQAVAAERSIWLASAYFMPNWAVIEALAGAARDGVDVRVLVPSKYDHPWLRRFATGFYQRLLKSGVRLWEWRGDMMHAKTTVVDGRWVRVGSTDFNLLGVAINYELDAMIDDRAIGERAEQMFLEDLEQSREIVLAGSWRMREVQGQPRPRAEIAEQLSSSGDGQA